eukprot:49799_1
MNNSSQMNGCQTVEGTVPKFIIVTGGVVSGLGKGIIISSIGKLLQSCGLRLTSIKIDPYLNMDAGTMSPFEHGEVFVLQDGGEADLDLGNYERFLGVRLERHHNITTGKVYSEVTTRERRGDYLGKTVQVVPHVTDEIGAWIERVACIPVDGSGKCPDVCLVEVGGTVGDIESMVFLEALRQLQFRIGRSNMCLVHASLVPVLGTVGEQKSKPTQHGVKELRGLGLHPDVIACRCCDMLQEGARRKISRFCQVPETSVISVKDVPNIYHVPMILRDQNVHKIFADQLGLSHRMHEPELTGWSAFANKVDDCKLSVKIVIVGKYTGLQDSYLSVTKALKHAAVEVDRSLELVWVEASDLERGIEGGKDGKTKYDDAWKLLEESDGIVIPGGFGTRGVEGKVQCAQWARTTGKPMLGICLGFQCMVIEFCRDVLGWKDANSTEIDEQTGYPVVIYMPEVSKSVMGGTMRLGARRTIFSSHKRKTHHSIVSVLYKGEHSVMERHRHRYEVNPEFVKQIEEKGMKFVGRDETGQRMEVLELDHNQHPYYVGTQYHPEFTSRPLCPAPTFLGLILAASGQPLPKLL